MGPVPARVGSAYPVPNSLDSWPHLPLETNRGLILPRWNCTRTDQLGRRTITTRFGEVLL